MVMLGDVNLTLILHLVVDDCVCMDLVLCDYHERGIGFSLMSY